MRQQRETPALITIGGRQFENAVHLSDRTGMGAGAIKTALDTGMPAPILMGKRRFFDIERVDEFLMRRTK